MLIDKREKFTASRAGLLRIVLRNFADYILLFECIPFLKTRQVWDELDITLHSSAAGTNRILAPYGDGAAEQLPDL